jgi:metal-sulfur cluster biosynthetic enzyme
MENSPAPTEADVYEVLRECYDPEIPVNLVDLGLIYGVQIDNRVVNVTMTLTAPGCQMGMMITQDIQDKLLGIPGCDDASVEIVWDPPWTPHMMTEAAKRQLKIDD